MLRPALLPAALAALLLLPACTGDAADDDEPGRFPAPAATAFDAGTCELVAEDVRALGRVVSELGDGPTVPPAARTELERAQKALQAVAETAEPELAPLLDAVVTRAGLVRLTIDAERYEPGVADPLAESYAALVEACTDGETPGPEAVPTESAAPTPATTPPAAAATVTPPASTTTAPPTTPASPVAPAASAGAAG